MVVEHAKRGLHAAKKSPSVVVAVVFLILLVLCQEELAKQVAKWTWVTENSVQATFFFSVAALAIVEPGVRRLLQNLHGETSVSLGARRLGFAERILFVGALLLGKPGFIPIWLIVKIGANWNQLEDRNKYLLGSAVSVIVAVFTLYLVKQILGGGADIFPGT